jgi:hypothetical protein
VRPNDGRGAPTRLRPPPTEFARLKQLLLDRPVAITAALRGAGGYGKTTLARVLCADPDIQDTFHVGILWTTLGENPGPLLSRLQDLIATLKGERSDFSVRSRCGIWGGRCSPLSKDTATGSQ